MEFGALLLGAGYRSAARRVYGQAVACHPKDAAAPVNLANILLSEGDAAGAEPLYRAALTLDPGFAPAHQGLAHALEDLGRPEAAARHRALGFAGRAVHVSPYRGVAKPIRVLQLVSARGGNVPTRLLLPDTAHAVTSVVAEYAGAALALPPHDLVFNAIGDADLCAEALAAAEDILAGTDRPVINPPARVAMTGRLENARRLADIAGLVTPRVIRARRTALADAAAAEGFAFPLLVRAPGHHTGRHFARIETPEDFSALSLPGDEALLIEALDARGADGHHRKYRVIAVAGAPFPLHLVVSTHWKAHYFTAAMADHPEHRAEEAAFLADPAAVVGAAGMRALGEIIARLGLDYAGIDFGLDPAGRILFFEANATMTIGLPGPEPMWDYRRPHAERAIAAARALIAARAPA